MNLEDRLRNELERSSRSTRVGTAPSVDELASVANGRRARNRVVGSAGAVALSATLLIGAFAATQPDDDGSVVLADGEADTSAVDEVREDTTAEDSETDIAAASDGSATAAGDVGEPDTAAEVPVAPEIEADASQTEAVGSDAEEQEESTAVVGGPILQNALQGDAGVLDVSVRESAVDFAGGSGVLIVADDAGYRGLAQKFGSNGALQVGLSSLNGLDWVETALVGVPADATASILRSFDDGHVALFSRFDVDSQVRQTFVGTSADLVQWDMSEPLPGQGFATDLAVGPAGVIVIGDSSEPNVWFGPLGGPFELTAQLDTDMLSGVTTLEEKFLVAGRSADLGITLFTSTDGVAWGARPLTSPDAEAASQSVSVADGTIVLTTSNEQGLLTLVSSDGAETWERLGEGELRSISVSGSALGFLGDDGGDATVTLSDGDSFASAQLDVAAPDRLSLLNTTSDRAVMLVQTDGGGVTWIVASR